MAHTHTQARSRCWFSPNKITRDSIGSKWLLQCTLHSLGWKRVNSMVKPPYRSIEWKQTQAKCYMCERLAHHLYPFRSILTKWFGPLISRPNRQIDVIRSTLLSATALVVASVARLIALLVISYVHLCEYWPHSMGQRIFISLSLHVTRRYQTTIACLEHTCNFFYSNINIDSIIISIISLQSR